MRGPRYHWELINPHPHTPRDAWVEVQERIWRDGEVLPETVQLKAWQLKDVYGDREWVIGLVDLVNDLNAGGGKRERALRRLGQ